jgi:hypothetical protein
MSCDVKLSFRTLGWLDASFNLSHSQEATEATAPPAPAPSLSPPSSPPPPQSTAPPHQQQPLHRHDSYSIKLGSFGRFVVHHRPAIHRKIVFSGEVRDLPSRRKVKFIGLGRLRKQPLCQAPIFSWRLPGMLEAGALGWVGYEACLPRTRSIPERSNSNLRRGSLLTRSLRRDLSNEMICETFATESFGNPVTRADRLTLPGAGAHFKLLVSGTQMAVEMRL